MVSNKPVLLQIVSPVPAFAPRAPAVLVPPSRLAWPLDAPCPSLYFHSKFSRSRCMRHKSSYKGPPESREPGSPQKSETLSTRGPWIYQDEEWKAAMEARLGHVEARQGEQENRLSHLEETSSFLQQETDTLRGDMHKIRAEIKRGCLGLDRTSLLIVTIISMVIYIIYINIRNL